MFAESSGDGEQDSDEEKEEDGENDSDEEKEEEVECDNDEELKDGKCEPIECDDGQELKDGKCEPLTDTSTGTVNSVPSNTVLKLESISNSDVVPGDPIEVKGTLVDDASSDGIKDKRVTIAVTGIADLPTESTTAETETDGKFTFTIPGDIPTELDTVKFKAHFEGDHYYETSESNEVTYEPRGGIPTLIELDPISIVNPGDPVIVQGILKTKSDGTGIDDRDIILEGKAIENLDIVKSDKTEGGGKFTFTIPGNVLIEGDSVNFQVVFGDDAPYSGTSKDVTYPPKGSIPTLIELDPISIVNPGDPVIVQGILKTKSDGTGIDGKTITLTKRPLQTPDVLAESIPTTGASAESIVRAGVTTYSAPTLSDGTFTFADIGSLDGALWEIQVLFGGDSEYGSSGNIEIYGTTLDTPRVLMPDMVLEESANEEPVETKLPIPGPDSLESCTFLDIGPVRGDKYNEIEKKGTDLIYKAKEKGKSKTFEYRIFYDCPDPEPPGPGPGPGPIEDKGPPAPVIEDPVSGTRETSIFEIDGTAEDYTKVEVFNGGTLLGTNTVDDGDWWMLELNTPLGDGTYSFTAKATDAAGNTGPPSPAVEVVVDKNWLKVIASPKGATFPSLPLVTLSSLDPNIDKIYYTTDGTVPDNTDTEFKDDISITFSPTTLKFRGYDKDGKAGPVGTEIYKKDIG